jgi:multiple sugar transport system ATP-binding protein
VALQLIDIHKSFNSNVVVDGITLEVGSGEIVVVFGPSGTGKTVLLRLVAGINDIDSGTIVIDGRDVTAEAPDARGIGMAFQNFALYPHMTAFDNIASALSARRYSRAEIAREVEAIVRLLRIDHVLDHFPSELSNGQKQRTSLARALVGAPKVLLLDDPLRNVDAKLRYEMRLELPNLLKKFNAAVLYVTQDYKEAMALADRIALVLSGKIVQFSSPAEIYERPVSVEVARLFGDPTINLVAVETRLDGERLIATVANTQLDLGIGFAHAAPQICTLGVRPECIRLLTTSQPNAVPVQILAETPLNEKIVLLAKTADGTELLASKPSGEETRFENGRAYALIEPSAALLFERQSGRRVERRLAQI